MKQRQFWLALSAAILAVGAPGSVYGFTMLGPFDTWMNSGLNYNITDVGALPSRNPRLNDSGGPQNLGEEYRRNVPVIYYAFDYAFLDYFGARGMQEVEAGVNILNELPNFSSMSDDLSEYPLESQRINYRASSLGLLDLKSTALGFMLEQIGLLSPHEYAWALRSKQIQANQSCPFYDVIIIRRNFDPVTWEPTSYINGALYTFVYEFTCPPAQSGDREDASEVPVDPLGFNWTAVASGFDQLNVGGFFDGLTRDDVGGLRYLYRKNNFNYEALPPDVSVGTAGSGSPWSPVDPNQTNALAVGASQLFAGVDRLQFVKVQYDSLLGQLFVPVTNNYSMTYITNSTQRTLGVSRAVAAPDIVFSASDLVGQNTVVALARNFPVYTQGSTLAAINGPGTITSAGGGNRITFNKVGPVLLGSYTPAAPFLSEATSSPTFRWGSFDGTTNPPVVYPSGISIKQMENLLFGGN